MKRSTYKRLGLVGLIVIMLAGGCQTSRQPSDRLPAAHLPTAVVPGASKPWPRSFTDDLGNTVTLSKPPQRIISLSPNLTEIVFLVGAGQQLAGRTDFCNYPVEAQAKPSIGGIINPSLEKLVSLQLEMKIPVLGYDPQTLDDVIALVRRIGRITGHDEQGDEAAKALAKRKDRVAAQHRGAGNSLRVLFVLSRDPLFVAAIRDVSTIDQTRPWPQASREAVVAADPQLVIIAQRHGVEQPERSWDILAQLQALPAWREVAAVKAGQVYLINDDLVTIPGPRLIEGLEEISYLISKAQSHH